MLVFKNQYFSLHQIATTEKIEKWRNAYIVVYESFLRANYNDMDMALDMTKYLASETQYAPWYVALGHLGYMLDQFYTKPLRRCFEVS